MEIRNQKTFRVTRLNTDNRKEEETNRQILESKGKAVQYNS